MTQKTKSPAKTQGKKITNLSSNCITLSNGDFIATAFATKRPDEYIWVCGFPGDPGNKSDVRWRGTHCPPLPASVTASNNTFISMSAYKRSASGNLNRSNECWSGLFLVFLDDVGNGSGSKVSLDALRLPPTCLIETSPGNHQAYYFLSVPERNAIRAEALLKGLAGAEAGDKGSTKRGQYGRLPQGINGKAKYRAVDGAPWAHRVHVWEPSRRYTVEEIAGAYSVSLELPTPRVSRKRKTPMHSADGYIDLLDWAGLYMEEIESGKHRIVCPWYQDHTDEDTSGTVYYEPSEENDFAGGFKCQHGHCSGRGIANLDRYMQNLLQLKQEKAA